tara:strand:+ start:15250 stop:15705 length:456 start_codon:yes stop_codon:yes gene_type:complete
MRDFREFKFRVWNGKTFRYTGDVSISMSHFPSGANKAPNGLWDIHRCGMVFHDILYEYTENQNDYQVHQFIGMIDHNGKDIYEGDILKETWSENQPYSLNSEEVYKNEDIYPVQYVGHGFLLADRTSSQLTIDDFERKVIGNIIENPELIK